MEVSYGKGPNNNLICLIPSNGGEEVYSIDGISNKPCNNQQERRELLFQIVQINNEIAHTHLIKLAQEFGHFAKRTIEKELKNLENDEFLESDKKGENYSNGSRRWFIKPPEFEFEKDAKKEEKDLVSALEKYLSTIEKHYENFNSARKAWAITNLLGVIHSYQPIIEIINQETKIKNEKKKLDSIVRRAYDILRKEKRNEIDGRPMLRRLLQLKSSEPMRNMNSYISQMR